MTYPDDPWARGGSPQWGGQQGPSPYGQQPQQPYPTGPQPQQPYQQSQPQQPYQTGPQPQQPYQQYPPTQQYSQQYPQQEYGQPYPPPHPQQGIGWGPPPDGGQYGYAGYAPPPPPKKRNGLAVGVIVVVMLLVVGGGATAFFAYRGAQAGAPSPKEAAVQLVNALGKNDVVGLVGGLAPSEADVINDYIEDGLDELKRLEVVKPDAKPDQITGVQITTQDLVFDDSAEEKVNDHLSITKLIDGKVTVSSDWSKLPLTDKFVEKAFPDGKPATPAETKTYDIGDEIAAGDGEPIRIATVKADGEWYPSLFYTVADYALIDAGKSWPAQGIGANGASSPEAAVKEALQAALDVDVQRLIELTPPDEMGALHDVGPLLVEAAQGEEPADATVVDLQTAVEDANGGKRVRLTRLELEAEGERFVVEINGDCLEIEEDGETEELCGADLADAVADLVEVGGGSLTEEQLAAIERAAIGYLHTGVVTTEIDGKWYLSPSRTFGDLSMGFLRKLQPGDLETLIALLNE